MRTTNLRWLARNLDYLRVPLNAAERAERPGTIPYWGANGIVDYVDSAVLDDRVILIGEDGAPFLERDKDVAFISSGAAWINNHIHILKADPRVVDDRFLTYFLNQIDYSLYINGSTRDKLTQAQLGRISVSYPDLATQHQIADFLDRETVRIDRLIENKQQLAELLNKKILAIYDSAVLGRTGEYSSFRKSAVPWIKNVPSHWEIKSLKRLLEIPITDGPHETPEFIGDGVLFISAESIQRGAIDFSRARGFISPEANERFQGKYSPKEGDIYIVKSGATTGRSAMVGAFIDFNIWSPLAVLRTSQLNDKKYILALVRSTPVQDAIKLSWSWGTQQNIGMGALGRILVPVPPLQEQRKLIGWIEARVKLVAPAIVAVAASIDRIKEYRSALISAAVSGQIDTKIYTRSGHTDRRLDEIREEMGA